MHLYNKKGIIIAFFAFFRHPDEILRKTPKCNAVLSIRALYTEKKILPSFLFATVVL